MKGARLTNARACELSCTGDGGGNDRFDLGIKRRVRTRARAQLNARALHFFARARERKLEIFKEILRYFFSLACVCRSSDREIRGVRSAEIRYRRVASAR